MAEGEQAARLVPLQVAPPDPRARPRQRLRVGIRSGRGGPESPQRDQRGDRRIEGAARLAGEGERRGDDAARLRREAKRLRARAAVEADDLRVLAPGRHSPIDAIQCRDHPAAQFRGPIRIRRLPRDEADRPGGAQRFALEPKLVGAVARTTGPAREQQGDAEREDATHPGTRTPR
jgi:hypothetical protein